MMPEWSKFKVGAPAINGFNPNCLRFETISHTSHVEPALNILDRGEIRPYLIFDESKLNDQRILVSWLSPNHWGVGFRYGNIRFQFDFKSLIKNKRFYWVESIAYKIPACRILVTDKNHDGDLERYDPTAKEGPWWHDTASDQHYYNGNHCLEFMFECSVSMKDIRAVDFVDHHPEYCSIHRTTPDLCKELGYRSHRGGAMFMARAVASGFSLENLSPYLIQDDGRPTFMLKYSFEELCSRVSRNVSFDGDLKANSKKASAVSQAICSAYSFHQIDTAKKLASLFRSEEECDSVLAMAVSKAVDLEKWAHLIEA